MDYGYFYDEMDGGEPLVMKGLQSLRLKHDRTHKSARGWKSMKALKPRNGRHQNMPRTAISHRDFKMTKMMKKGGLDVKFNEFKRKKNLVRKSALAKIQNAKD